MNGSLLGLTAALVAGWGLGVGVNRLAQWLPGRLAGMGEGRRPAAWRERGITAAAAVCGGLLWLRFGLTWTLVWAVGVTGLLLLVAAIDLDHRLVFNKVLLAGVALAALRVLGTGPGLLASALLAGALGFGIFALLAAGQRGALGAGDVKLAGVLGLMLGYPAVLTALLVGVLCGGIAAAGLLLSRRVSRRAFIPYAPFLAIGGISALLRIAF